MRLRYRTLAESVAVTDRRSSAFAVSRPFAFRQDSEELLCMLLCLLLQCCASKYVLVLSPGCEANED